MPSKPLLSSLNINESIGTLKVCKVTQVNETLALSAEAICIITDRTSLTFVFLDCILNLGEIRFNFGLDENLVDFNEALACCAA